MIINVLVILSYVGIFCGLLLYIGPRGWITTAKSESMRKLLQGRPPPWKWLNKFGRWVHVTMYICFAGWLMTASVGVYMEG